MESIYIKARAKINLNLEIVGKREDNYHNLSSVFQKINLYDELYIQKTETNDLEIETNIRELNNKENIIYKAYVALKQKYKNKELRLLLNFCRYFLSLASIILNQINGSFLKEN